VAFRPVLQNNLTVFLRTSPKLRMLGPLPPPLPYYLNIYLQNLLIIGDLLMASFSRICEKIAFVEILVKIY